MSTIQDSIEELKKLASEIENTNFGNFKDKLEAFKIRADIYSTILNYHKN